MDGRVAQSPATAGDFVCGSPPTLPSSAPPSSGIYPSAARPGLRPTAEPSWPPLGYALIRQCQAEVIAATKKRDAYKGWPAARGRPEPRRPRRGSRWHALRSPVSTGSADLRCTATSNSRCGRWRDETGSATRGSRALSQIADVSQLAVRALDEHEHGANTSAEIV